MLRITNQTLKRIILDQIVESIDSGGLDDLLQAGFSPEFLDSMRHRPARDLIKIAEIPSLEFRVSIQEREISAYLSRLDRIRQDSQMCEYFVRHGAAVQVVCNLFRMSAEDVRALRAQLLPPQEQAGRNRMPPIAVRDQIHARWHALRQAMPQASQRDWLYELHQAFPDIRIDALCRSLNEFAEEPSWQVTDFGAA